MRYPVNNYKEEWDNHAGYDYGDATSYGFHDGKDINDNGGGNSDLGKPLFAISQGRVVGIHKHTGTGNFGNHFFLMVEGVWGTRYVHYAHCLEVFVSDNQEVEEGFKVATVGNSGTTYAHCHFAIKKIANGMDTVAHNRAELDEAWENPIAFIEANTAVIPPIITSSDYSKRQAIIDVYYALTGQLPNDDEINFRLESNKNMVEIITDICSGDSRFFDLWIQPKIPFFVATGADPTVPLVIVPTPPETAPTIQPSILSQLSDFFAHLWQQTKR